MRKASSFTRGGEFAATLPTQAPVGGPTLILYFLAVAFVASTFFDKFIISSIPLLDNPASIVGLALAVLYFPLRLPYLRLNFINGMFLLFIVSTLVIELPRVFSGGTFNYQEFAAYAQYLQVFGIYVMFFDLARDVRLLKQIGVATIAACTLMSLMSHLGFMAFDSGDRTGIAGLNLNYQAFLYCQCLVGVFCWLLYQWPKFGKVEFILSFCAVSCLYSLMKTASRGGATTLVFGVLLCMVLLFRRKHISAYAFLVPIILGGILFALLKAEALQSRFGDTVERGNTGLRAELLEESRDMFFERPLIGWGADYYETLSDRMLRRKRIATHNTYTQIIVSFGMVGMIPWLLALGVTVWATWRLREDVWGITLFVVLICLLLQGMTLNLGHTKFAWVVLALAGGLATQRSFTPAPTRERVVHPWQKVNKPTPSA